MALKTGITKQPSTGTITFGGNRFTLGVKTNQTLVCNLTTDSLKGRGGSKPASGACTIVDEFNTTYDLRDRIDIKVVKKNLGKIAVVRKIQKAKKPGPVLELLGLDGLLLLSDYNNLNASRFAKGHLLPESLGGPGAEWNLTPMDRSANALWSSSFEQAVRRDLTKAEQIEKGTSHRVVVEYKVTMSGQMKPWFQNPTDATRYLLSNLPASVSGSTRIVGYLPKAGGNAPVSLADKAKFKSLFDIGLDLKL